VFGRIVLLVTRRSEVQGLPRHQVGALLAPSCVCTGR
jgi:hypothetical protein